MGVTAETIWNEAIEEERLNNTSQRTLNSLGLRWIDMINRDFYTILYQYDPNSYVTDDTITVVDGTTEYDLASNFHDMLGNDCGIKQFNDDGSLKSELFERKRGDTRNGFYIDMVAGKIRLTGSVAAGTWTHIFIPTIDTISDAGDNLIIPTRLEYKAKRIYIRALHELIKDRNERSAGDIAADAQRKLNHVEEFKMLIRPAFKTIERYNAGIYYKNRRRVRVRT